MSGLNELVRISNNSNLKNTTEIKTNKKIKGTHTPAVNASAKKQKSKKVASKGHKLDTRA